ncbi:hypothetical protein O3M35_002241 [Rhynocoris fuscipes]|uniref:Mannosyltransferase n=1 Tax=Rhynocoris fuscipes TaxID=488301 RepID=A0AAW1CRV1_9HEMI
MKTLVSYGKFPYSLWFVMLFFRCVDLVWIQSSYVPDEYWQSLEVAHNKVFGYGYLTWEWTEGIRSYIYVTLISGLYYLLKFFDMDTAEAIITSPRILQGIISSIADVYFIRWVHEKRNGQYSWAFISWVTCYFISYCSTRTLLNTFEMNLTTIALYYYPWSPKANNLTFVLIVTLLVFARPTAAIVWLPFVLINIVSMRKPLNYFLTTYLPIGLLVSGICIALDSWMHGSIVITPWNFFKFNVLKDVGSHYGAHPSLWYFYAGIPAILGVHTFTFYYGFLKTIYNRLSKYQHDVEAQMSVCILWTLLVYSFLPHKEFRFLMPLLPMMIYISSGIFSRWSVTASSALIYIVGTIMILTNMISVLYLGQFHQVGTLETMSNLRETIKNDTNIKIVFLAPCHSFPGYSHLHANITTRYLSCLPNLENESDYQDETERFYNNTAQWLNIEYTTLYPCTLPSHLVFFNSLKIPKFLSVKNYTLHKEIFNNLHYSQPREGESIYIYRRKGKRCY